MARLNETVSEKVLGNYEEYLANDPSSLYQDAPGLDLAHNFIQVFLRGLGEEQDANNADDFSMYPFLFIY